MGKIITEFKDRDEFKAFVKRHRGVVIVKFGAVWCTPCKKIKSYVMQKFSKMPSNVVLADLDIDQNDDVYAFSKCKSIPTIISFVNGDMMDVVVGTKENELEDFFRKVEAHASM